MHKMRNADFADKKEKCIQYAVAQYLIHAISYNQVYFPLFKKPL